MRRCALVSVIMTITLVVIASCTESDNRSKIVELQKTYDQFSQAMADQDTAKVMSFIDPEAEFIDPQSNRTTAAQYRTDYEKFFAEIKDLKVTCTLMDTQIDGSKAAVYLDWDARFLFHHEKENLWVPFILKARLDATWEKKDGAWKLTRTQTLHFKQHIDPQWIAEYKKQYEMLAKFIDRASAGLLPCNLSYNGCR